MVQVGLGSWGGDWARTLLPTMPEVDVVGYVDAAPAALQSLIASNGASKNQCFSSLTDAIASVDPEAVLVTTDVSAHFPVVEAALTSGRHVLTEKPLALSLAEAESLIATADRVGRTLMVSQNYRFHPAVRAVQKIVAEGDLGALLGIGIDFMRRAGKPSRSGNAGKRRDREPLLRDMAIHHFDLMRAISGRDACEVDCRTWSPDPARFSGPISGTALITMDDGTVVSYRGTFASAQAQTAWAGEWRMEFERGDVWWTSRGEPDRVRVTTAHGDDREWALPEVVHRDRAGVVHEFVSSLQEGRQPETVARDNIKSYAMACAAIESARTRTSVAVPTIAAVRPA